MSDNGEEIESRLWREAQALVVAIEPRVIEIFQRNRVVPEQASEILHDVIRLLLYRWDEVKSPETWVLEMLEHRAWRLRPREPVPTNRP